MRSHARTTVLLGGLFAASSAGLIAIAVSHEAARAGSATMTAISLKSDELSATEAARVLSLLGLQPEVVAASGMTTAHAQAMLGDLRTIHRATALALLNANTAARQARRDYQAAVATLRGGAANARQVRDAAVARDLRRAELQQSIVSLRAVLLTPRGDDVMRRANRIAEHRDRPVPIAYKTLDLTSAEWIRLRDVLSASASSQRRGTQIDSGDLLWIGQLQQDTDVVAARGGIDTHGAAIARLYDTELLGSR